MRFSVNPNPDFIIEYALSWRNGSSSIFCHILLSINIRFFVRTVPEWNSLPEAVSTRISSPHFRRSSVTPHRRDKQKRSDNYWTRTRTRRALDLRSTGRGFKSYSGQKQRNNLGQVVHTCLPLSPSSITWYQPRNGDAMRLGR